MEGPGKKRLGTRAWLATFGPDSDFLDSCRRWIRAGKSFGGIMSFLAKVKRDFRQAACGKQLQLLACYLQAAERLRDDGPFPDASCGIAEDLASSYGLPVVITAAIVDDLVEDAGMPEPVKVVLPAAVVPENSKDALIVSLELWVADCAPGQESIQPCPATALWLRGLDSAEVLGSQAAAHEAARNYAGWMPSKCVLWRLTLGGLSSQVDPILKGGSLEAPISFGAALLMARQVFDRVNGQQQNANEILEVEHPERVLFTGSWNPLKRTRSKAEKLAGCSFGEGADRIDSVVFPAQDSHDLRKDKTNRESYHHAETWFRPRMGPDLLIHAASSLADAVHGLLIEQTGKLRESVNLTYQTAAPICSGSLPDFKAAIQSHTPKWVAISDPDGRLAAEIVRNLQNHSYLRRAAAFVIDPNGKEEDPLVVIKDLIHQVRRKHRLYGKRAAAEIGALEAGSPFQNSAVGGLAMELAALLEQAWEKTGEPEWVFLVNAHLISRRTGSHLILPELVDALVRSGARALPFGMVVTSADWQTTPANALRIKDLQSAFASTGDPQPTGKVPDWFISHPEELLGGPPARVRTPIAAGLLSSLGEWLGSHVSSPAGLICTCRSDPDLETIGILIGAAALEALEREIAQIFPSGAPDLHALFSAEYEKQQATQGLSRTLAGQVALRRWHSRWAACSSKCLGSTYSGARNYAIDHVLTHYRLAEEWENFIRCLEDFDYLKGKIDRPTGLRDLCRTLEKALHGRNPIPSSSPARDRIGTLAAILQPLAESMVVADSQLVFQELHNQLPLQPRWRQSMEFFVRLSEHLGKSKRSWLRATGEGGDDSSLATRPRHLLHHHGSAVCADFSRRRTPQNRSIVASVGGHLNTLKLWKLGNPHPHFEFAFRNHRSVHPHRYLPPAGVHFCGADCNDVLVVEQSHCWLFRGVARETGLPGGSGVEPFPLRLAHKSARVLTTEGRIDPAVLISPSGFVAHSTASSQSCLPQIVAVGGFVRLFPSQDLPDGPRPGFALIGIEDEEVRLLATTLIPPDFCLGQIQPEKNDYYICVAISPDGKRVACSAPDYSIFVLELNLAETSFRTQDGWVDMRVVAHLPSLQRRPEAIAFSPDGSFLAVGGGFNSTLCELWSLDGEASGLVFSAHQNSIWSLAFARLSDEHDQLRTVLFTGSYDRTFAAWDVASLSSCATKVWHRERWQHHGMHKGVHAQFVIRELLHPPTPLAVQSHQDVVTHISVSPDQRRIATGGIDHDIKIWSVPDLVGPRRSPSLLFKGHTLHAATLAKNRLLITGSATGNLCLWKAEEGPMRLVKQYSLPGPPRQEPSRGRDVRGISTSESGRWIAVASDCGLCLVDTTLPQSDSNPRRLSEGPCSTVALKQLDPNDLAPPILAGGRRDGTIEVHRLIRFDEVAPEKNELHLHDEIVRGLAFALVPSADGPKLLLASISEDKQICISTLTRSGGSTGQACGIRSHHVGRPKSLAISPDGLRVASGGFETIYVYSRKSVQSENWSLHSKLRGHHNEIWHLSWSHLKDSVTGSYLLASCSKDQTFRVWSPDGSRTLLGTVLRPNSVLAAKFLSDRGSGVHLRVADAGNHGVPGWQDLELVGRQFGLG